MPSQPPSPPGLAASDVERWLGELGLEPAERIDREHVTSWDLRLDGLRRFADLVALEA